MTSARKAAMEMAILLSIAAIYIVQQLIRLEWLTPLNGCLIFTFISLQLPKLRGMTKWLTVVFVAFGAILLLIQKTIAWDWFEAVSINVPIVTLFLFAPLLGIPVRIPEYVEALKRFYERNLRSKSGLFAGTQLLTQLMGVFINVGAIPVVYEMIFVKSQQGMARLLCNALNRGFAGAIFWSPYFAAMTLVTSSLALSWSSLLPYVLGLSLISLFVSRAVDARELSQAEPLERNLTVQQGKATFPIGLGMYLIAAIIVILALERTVKLPMVILICMAAVMFPLFWCMGKRVMIVYRQGLLNHVTVTLPSLQKEITLFLSAGFFSGAIGKTGFGSAVPALLELVSLPISLTFSIFTVVLIVGTAFIGLHPIVPVTILAGGIDPLDVQMSSVYFAVLLLGSWGLSNPISPASAANNLLAGLSKRPVLEVASSNYKFAVWMAITLLLYLATISTI